ncbi:MAG: 30S ribosomal protein S13 [Mycoplasmataceae bacterium]|nr:MAG: 30S ribosomal protein S13 [Mycoplasmataceae bacterium]
MVRISNIDIPGIKNIEVSLTYIYGIGKSRAQKIVKKLDIDGKIKAKNLTDKQISDIGKEIKEFSVEGELRQFVSQCINDQIRISCYKGLRRIKHLPIRGQSSRHNARTNKGVRKTVANKKRSTALK